MRAVTEVPRNPGPREAYAARGLARSPQYDDDFVCDTRNKMRSTSHWLLRTSADTNRLLSRTRGHEARDTRRAYGASDFAG